MSVVQEWAESFHSNADLPEPGKCRNPVPCASINERIRGDGFTGIPRGSQQGNSDR